MASENALAKGRRGWQTSPRAWPPPLSEGRPGRSAPTPKGMSQGPCDPAEKRETEERSGGEGRDEP